MSTCTRPDRSMSGSRLEPRLDAPLQIARGTLVGLGALLLGLGAIVWSGNDSSELVGFHFTAGVALVLALWTVAFIAARAGVSIARVALVVAWSVAALVLAMTQDRLLVADWHWTIEVLHVVIGVGIVAWGWALVAWTHQRRLAG